MYTRAFFPFDVHFRLPIRPSDYPTYLLRRPLGTADRTGLLAAQPLVDALQMEAVVARAALQGTIVAGILHPGRDALEGILADAADVVLLVVAAVGGPELVGAGGGPSDVPAPPGDAVEAFDVDLELRRGLLPGLGSLPRGGRPGPNALPGTLGGAGLRWVGRGRRGLLGAAVFGIQHLDVVVERRCRLPFPGRSRHGASYLAAFVFRASGCCCCCCCCCCSRTFQLAPKDDSLKRDPDSTQLRFKYARDASRAPMYSTSHRTAKKRVDYAAQNPTLQAPTGGRMIAALLLLF